MFSLNIFKKLKTSLPKSMFSAKLCECLKKLKKTKKKTEKNCKCLKKLIIKVFAPPRGVPPRPCGHLLTTSHPQKPTMSFTKLILLRKCCKCLKKLKFSDQNQWKLQFFQTLSAFSQKVLISLNTFAFWNNENANVLHEINTFCENAASV